MKVKIGNEEFTSTEQPICIILNNKELDELFDMVGKRLVRYCCYPKGHDEEKVRKWIGKFA